MNGSQAMVKTLLAGHVDVCFANPGTSEMHFVAALDQATAMRCVGVRPIKEATLACFAVCIVQLFTRPWQTAGDKCHCRYETLTSTRVRR